MSCLLFKSVFYNFVATFPVSDLSSPSISFSRPCFSLLSPLVLASISEKGRVVALLALKQHLLAGVIRRGLVLAVASGILSSQIDGHEGT